MSRILDNNGRVNSVLTNFVIFFSVLVSFPLFSISDEAQLSSPEGPPTKARNISWCDVVYQGFYAGLKGVSLITDDIFVDIHIFM